MLVIRGRTPSKKNSRINTRSGRSFPSIAHKEWHEDALWQLRAQKAKPVKTPCAIVLRIWYPDYRSADNTNKAESVHDLLVDAGIIIDDNWQEIYDTRQIAMGVDVKNPRVEIEFLQPSAVIMQFESIKTKLKFGKPLFKK